MQRNLLDSSIEVFYYCKLRVKIALWKRWNTAANVICISGIKRDGWNSYCLLRLYGMSGTPVCGPIQREGLVSLGKFDMFICLCVT